MVSCVLLCTLTQRDGGWFQVLVQWTWSRSREQDLSAWWFELSWIIWCVDILDRCRPPFFFLTKLRAVKKKKTKYFLLSFYLSVKNFWGIILESACTGICIRAFNHLLMLTTQMCDGHTSTETYDYVTYIPSFNSVREREIRPTIKTEDCELVLIRSNDFILFICVTLNRTLVYNSEEAGRPTLS